MTLSHVSLKFLGLFALTFSFLKLALPIFCDHVSGLVFVSGPCVCLAECFCLVQKMHMLNLCSGTGSVSKAFVRGGWEIVDVVWDPRHGPTHCVDIMSWECPYPPLFFDVVWCSPDCTQYNRARTTANTPRDFDNADALVQKCLDLIDYLKPRFWFLETQTLVY